MDWSKVIQNIDQKIIELNLFEEILPRIKLITLIRRPLYETIPERHKFERSNYTKKNIKYYLNIFYFSFLSFIHIFSLIIKNEKSNFLVIGFARRTFINEKWQDPIFKDFISENQSDAIVLERPFKGRHEISRENDELIYFIDIIFYLEFLISIIIIPFIFFKFRKLLQAIRPKIEELGVEYTKFRFKILLAISSLLVQSVIAKLLLKILQPNALLISTRWLNFGFIKAARELSIPIIEFQHGAIFDDNSFYKDYDDGDLNVNFMGTFSSYWNDRPWGNCERIVVGKSIHTQEWQHRTAKTEFVESRRVLFISEPLRGVETLNDVKILASNNSEFYFDIKLHPQQRDKFTNYKREFETFKNIELLVNPTRRQYSIIIGYSSTLMFELSDLGYPVATLIENRTTESFTKFGIPFLSIQNTVHLDDLNIKPYRSKFFEKPNYDKLLRSIKR